MPNSKSKLLLVNADENIWATTIRANQLKKYLTNYDVTITDGKQDYNFDEYDIVHILYSGGIGRYKNYIVEHPNKVFTTVASFRTLDCVYDKIEDLEEVYKNSRKIVCLNPQLVKRIISLIGPDNKDKAVYIPNGVDADLFTADFTVGYVGAVGAEHAEYKGLHLIREACEKLGVKLLTDKN